MGFLYLFAAHLLAPPGDITLYRCLDGTMFTLSISPTQAIVRFADGIYRLPRRSSAIAVKYASEAATLYLDDEFAAFVAEDRPLPGCSKVPESRR
jgi:hypothetical protein